MKVSVVVPAYNEEKYIKKCLFSLTNQIVPADEIIIVDNNCRDKTIEIAKKFKVRIVKEKTQGMIPARNRGFNSTRYEIIARCDADVIVPKDWIKRIKKNFENEAPRPHGQGSFSQASSGAESLRSKNASLTHGLTPGVFAKGDKKIDALTGPVTFTDLFRKETSSTPSKIYLESLRAFSRGKRHLIGPNMALRKDIWNKVKNIVNLDDKKVHEDIDLSLNIAKVKGKIGYDPKLIVGISARRLKKHPESFFLEYPIRMVKTFLANKN